ncbi:MAG: porin family protein [Novosphingobium sp.]|nr:porin family protein [Novosphingobium sp.]
MTFRPLTTSRALAAGVVLAGPALAQDRATHFDGPYISIVGGLSAQGNDNRSDRLVFDTDGDGKYDDAVNTAAGANAFSPGFCGGVATGATRADGCRGDKDKAEYGARIGFDKRSGNLVTGALVEVSRSRSSDGVSGFSTTPAGYAFDRELDYAVSLRARAGYTPGGGALFYVTGGGSYAKIDHSFTTTNTANAFDERRDGKMVWGWQAGGGTEIMVTDHVSLGLEYLYNRYDDSKYNVAVTQGTVAPTNPFILASSSTAMRPSDTKYDFHSLRASLGFRF